MVASLALLAALVTAPSPAPSVSPAPQASAAAPAEDPAITKLAREQYDAFAAGKVDATKYSAAIPADAIAQVQAGLTALGPVKSVILLRTVSSAQGTVYVYKFIAENGAALEQLSVKDGKIDGIYFMPAK